MRALPHSPMVRLGLGQSFKWDSITTQDQKLIPKKSTYGTLFSLLNSSLKKPAAAFESLIDEFWTGSNEDSAFEKTLEERKSILKLKLKAASTYGEWITAAAELDELEGNTVWKDEEESEEYNFTLVRSRLDQLENARNSHDIERMTFLIRTSLRRGLGGMGNITLYKHSHTGTKRLIERYVMSVLHTLSTLLETSQKQHIEGVDPRMLLEQLVFARQSFGRSALLLSGGGTFGMSHIGVLKCLWEHRLLPRIISGASAGSIVCSVLGVSTDEEVPLILDNLCNEDLNVFTKKGEDDNILRQVAHFLKNGSLFDIAHLIGIMKKLLGDLTFQEAYNRTRRILNICVSTASIFELPRLLNYITAPNVIIWSAVAASCSVPVIFSPADILAKDPRTGASVRWNPSSKQWIDGSVDNDLPMTRLAEMFNVNHFIVSQVNPHVVPFLTGQESGVDDPTYGPQHAFNTNSEWLHKLVNVAKDEAMHRMLMLSELGFFPNALSKTRSVLSQRYSGDITILPEISYMQFPKALQNPTPEFMLQATLQGERATWPRLSQIENHCAIEFALDDAISQLRARIAFSPSQVDLRLNGFSGHLSRAASDGGRKGRRFNQHRRFKTLHASGPKLPSPIPTKSNQTALPSQVSPNHVRSNPLQINTSKAHNLAVNSLVDSNKLTRFSTGDDGDDSASSSASAPLDISSEAEEDYFSQPFSRHKGRPSPNSLFPHASQPSSPWVGRRMVNHGTSSPVPGAALVARLSTLAMTPSSPIFTYSASQRGSVVTTPSIPALQPDSRSEKSYLPETGKHFSRSRHGSKTPLSPNITFSLRDDVLDDADNFGSN